MKIQIRTGVFETNSSSVHSLTMCSKEEFKNWKDGEAYFDSYNHEILSQEEGLKRRNKYLEIVKKDIKKEFENHEYEEGSEWYNYLKSVGVDNLTFKDLYDWDIIDDYGIEIYDEDNDTNAILPRTYHEVMEDWCSWCETFEEEKKIEGKDIVAFGYYGHD